jgi:Phytanoyl-CoA dioxygenase (PhyH)
MPALDNATVRALLARLAPSESQVDDLCRRAHDYRYWLELNPDLTIGQGRENGWLPDAPTNGRTMAAAVAHYRRDGYASLDHVLAVHQAERMRKCIETLRAHDWPPVFAFVYDAFWQIGHVPAVHALLRELLGEEPLLLPRVWAHYVAAVGNSGWLPHIDGRPGSAPTMSLWIPISEATLSNGCMYVVARDEQTQALGEAFSPGDATYTVGDVKSLLRRTTACPARPGQILLWDERIIHWGAAYEAGAPRVSLALEFSTQAFVPAHGELPIVPLGEAATLPGLRFRLRAIGRALVSYRRFEPLLERFTPLANRLVRGDGPSA